MRPPGLDHPDMQYGDVQRLKDAMTQVPPVGGGPQPPGTPQPQTKPAGTTLQPPGSMPPFLMDHESGRPEEPITAGLDVGAGPGSEALMSPAPPPDLRELVLEYLYWTYDNKDAYEMLHQLREERAAQPKRGPVPPPVSRPTPLQSKSEELSEEEPPLL